MEIFVPVMALGVMYHISSSKRKQKTNQYEIQTQTHT